MTLRIRSLYTFLLLFTFALSATTASAATRVVDDDGEATAKNCNSGTDTPYTTITSAVADSNPLDKIVVCPGNYAEQITITFPLTITGVGAAVLKPVGHVVNASSTVSGAPIAAIIFVKDTTGVTIEQLAVDGSGAGPFSGCGTNLVGIYYQNASGAVRNAAVRNIHLGPSLEGCQAGLGIFVQSDEAGPGVSNVTVTGTSVHNFQKNGITGNEVGTTLTATGNVVSGWGPTTFLAQNGIQVAWGAKGTVKSNRVIDVVWSPCSTPEDPDCSAGSATGILFFQTADASTVSLNTVGTSQTGVYLEGNSSFVTANDIQNTSTYDGVAIVGNSNQVTSNAIFDSDEAGIFLWGDSNTVQKNVINEAPVGVLVGDGTGNTIPVTGTGRNIFYNVGTNVVLPAAITVSSTPVGRGTPQPAR